MDAQLSTGTVNVLDLGVKNDGSEDVSRIVNEATVSHRLFFPAGFYKVEKPLYLQNSICGAGYCRNNRKSPTDTWFISAMDLSDTSAGVLNYDGESRLNVENLNIECSGQECGILLAGASQKTMTLIEKVGIYNVKGYGIHIQGRGSRPVFLQNLTIFGSRDYPVPGVGICVGNFDNRFMNIEVMGCRVGLELINAGPVYGDNLHLWTGCMSGTDNGTWWRGTRGVIVRGNSQLVCSQIYPDTCFYALEQADADGGFMLHNVIYWEDTNTKTAPDFDGEFFHCDGDFEGNLQIDGGYIAVMEKNEVNGRMQSVYMAGQKVRDVMLRTNVPLTAENLSKLCLSDHLPDYTLTYREQGFCKAADLFTAAESGYVEAGLSMEDGACWILTFLKRKGEKVEVKILPQNPLCDGRMIQTCETADGILSVFFFNGKEEILTLRFTTRSMGRKFRPVDYGTLRTLYCGNRSNEVRNNL